MSDEWINFIFFDQFKMFDIKVGHLFVPHDSGSITQIANLSLMYPLANTDAKTKNSQ